MVNERTYVMSTTLKQTLVARHIGVHDLMGNVELPNRNDKEQHREYFLNDLSLYVEFYYILVAQVQPNSASMIPHYHQSISSCQYLRSGKEWPTSEEAL